MFETLYSVWLQSQPFFLFSVALFCLIVGSFLNVVIYRLPVMMTNQWRYDCQTFLAEEANPGSADNIPVPTKFNLLTPKSTCPHCKSAIKPWFNIPILGYLLTKGKCHSCSTAISIRYPAIELLTMLVGLTIAYSFGVTWLTALYLLLSFSLLCLMFIDIDHMLLPDQITLPLLWIALLASAHNLTIAPAMAIIGAATGYLSLWSVFWLYKLVTGKEGMGYGDFKLMAVFGAFLGWQAILPIVLISSVVGAVIGISLIIVQGRDKAKPMPFGPYIAIAGWIVLVWGKHITSVIMPNYGY